MHGNPIPAESGTQHGDRSTRHLTVLGAATAIGLLTAQLLDTWQHRIADDFLARTKIDTTTRDARSYPMLAQHPVLTGILIGCIVLGLAVWFIRDETPAR